MTGFIVKLLPTRQLWQCFFEGFKVLHLITHLVLYFHNTLFVCKIISYLQFDYLHVIVVSHKFIHEIRHYHD